MIRRITKTLLVGAMFVGLAYAKPIGVWRLVAQPVRIRQAADEYLQHKREEIPVRCGQGRDGHQEFLQQDRRGDWAEKAATEESAADRRRQAPRDSAKVSGEEGLV